MNIEYPIRIHMQRITIARVKDATFFPDGVSLISGSAVRFPRISTLLIELIIIILLIF